MNLVELDHALRKLRLSGMAAVLETRLRQAQTDRLAPIDLVSTLVSDELLRRQDRLLERRHKQAGFRDPDRSLDRFDFDFNKKMNRALIHDLATGRFIAQREDGLFLGPPGTGKSHLAQAIGRAVIQQGYRVLYREAHTLLEELADATLDGTRKVYLADLAALPLLNEATREVIALSMSELQRHRVMLRPELADDLPVVTANRVQLQQVILNLLRNASDAMVGVDDGPRQLLVRTERDERDRVRLTVEDVGVGLEPHVMDKLFQAFFTTKSNGMGIGLSVSRSIIEKHGGRLWGEPNDGPGATFAFSIPRVPERTNVAARVMRNS